MECAVHPAREPGLVVPLLTSRLPDQGGWPQTLPSTQQQQGNAGSTAGTGGTVRAPRLWPCPEPARAGDTQTLVLSKTVASLCQAPALRVFLEQIQPSPPNLAPVRAWIRPASGPPLTHVVPSWSCPRRLGSSPCSLRALCWGLRAEPLSSSRPFKVPCAGSSRGKTSPVPGGPAQGPGEAGAAEGRVQGVGRCPPCVGNAGLGHWRLMVPGQWTWARPRQQRAQGLGVCGTASLSATSASVHGGCPNTDHESGVGPLRSGCQQGRVPCRLTFPSQKAAAGGSRTRRMACSSCGSCGTKGSISK